MSNSKNYINESKRNEERRQKNIQKQKEVAIKRVKDIIAKDSRFDGVKIFVDFVEKKDK